MAWSLILLASDAASFSTGQVLPGAQGTCHVTGSTGPY
ncbi:hypothetical protein RB628_01290 [Streptomyces sp. ADMS]|nr:hypothetical protein [Streptomyces sp. ADMS]MDW4904009.1 hypothetical protein [Streptomyces sp. ADMS]